MARVKLVLISDVDIYQLIKKDVTGGQSNIAQRYSKASNKYIKSYDKDKPSNYITYLDINNLYGWAMVQYLPTNRLDMDAAEGNNPEGCTLEVDFENPATLRDLHYDNPLAPRKTDIKKN